MISLKVNTLNYYTLVDLDSQTTGNDFSSTSDAIRQMKKVTYSESSIEFYNKGEIETEKEKTTKYILSENDVVLVDSMKIYFENNELTPDEDFQIIPFISPHIIPYNYYKGYSNSAYVDKAKIMCTYRNLDPTYKLRTFTLIQMKSIINTKNYNFGIKDTLLTPFSYTAESGTDRGISTLILDIKYPNDITMDQSLKEIFAGLKTKEIKQLFLMNSFYDTRMMFAAVAYDNQKGTIYIFKVEEESELIIYADSICDVIGLTANEGIKAIGINSDYLYIASSNKFYAYKRNSGDSTYDAGKSSVLQEEIKDLLVNKDTVYIIDKKGLSMFVINSYDASVSNLSLTILIKHNHFIKLDYVPSISMDKYPPYYIGITVDNQPGQGFHEILIELLANNQYEKDPLINRVYTTKQLIKIEDMITDKNLRLSYIFDRQSSKLFILTRGIPNVENNFSFSFDLSKDYTFTSSSQEDFVSLLSVKGNAHTNELVIMDANALVIFEEFLITKQFLHCTFNKAGEYLQAFSIQEDCSYLRNPNEYFLQTCKSNYYFRIKVASGNNLIILWVFIAIILVGINVTALVLWLCKCCCFGKPRRGTMPTSNIPATTTTQGHYDHNEMVEVPIDNRI